MVAEPETESVLRDELTHEELTVRAHSHFLFEAYMYVDIGREWVCSKSRGRDVGKGH